VRRTAAFTGLPVLITESGIATEDDTERIAYIEAVLRDVHACLAEGIDVRGYFVWCLLDNFEWNMGYGPKLGLHAVDRTTFERTAKPSAAWYADVARTNRLGDRGH
jgi:beta-glucosidase